MSNKIRNVIPEDPEDGIQNLSNRIENLAAGEDVESKLDGIKMLYREAGSRFLKENYFDEIFLRDCCTCPRCVDPSTSQKLFESASIPLTLQCKNVCYGEDGTTKIEWKNDIPGYENHISKYPPEFCSQNLSFEARLEASHRTPAYQTWSAAELGKWKQAFEHQAFMDSDPELHALLKQLASVGVAFLKKVPSDPQAVKAIANRIGPIRSTFYGDTWNVRSVPSAKNVAYTSKDLGFHMDLLYMANPPGLQLLHCMKASASGGESLFSDSFKAVEGVHAQAPDLLNALFDFPVTYRYKNDGHWYQYTRPTIELYTWSKGNKVSAEHPRLHPNALRAVNWSPPFQGPFEHDAGEFEHGQSEIPRLRHYVKAAALFKSELEKPSSVFETKMEEGTCVIFDNRRIVHARKAFTLEGGERWLRGTYIVTDAYKSRFRVLDEKEAMHLTRTKKDASLVQL